MGLRDVKARKPLHFVATAAAEAREMARVRTAASSKVV